MNEINCPPVDLDVIRIGDQVSWLDEIEGRRVHGYVFGVNASEYRCAFGIDRRDERLVPAKLITKEVG